MKANKRVRDLRRRSGERLIDETGIRGTTTYPTLYNKVKATKALRRR